MKEIKGQIYRAKFLFLSPVVHEYTQRKLNMDSFIDLLREHKVHVS